MQHMFVSEPLHRLIQSAQLVAVINGIVGAIFALTLLIVRRETPLSGLMLGYAGAACLFSSVVLVVLARYMNAGKPWAFVGTCIVSMILLLQVLFDLAFFIFNFEVGRGFFRAATCVGVVHLPHLYLAIEAMNTVEPLRDLYRQRRRERLAMRRAFEPIFPPPPPPPRNRS